MSTTKESATTGHGLFGLDTPDITSVQVVALVEALIAAAVAMGFDMSDGKRTALIALASVVAAILAGSDAYIRNGRSKAVAAKAELERAWGDVRREFDKPETAAAPAAGRSGWESKPGSGGTP